MAGRPVTIIVQRIAQRINYLRFGGNRPSFFILGAQKAGTSSLFEYLNAQPGLCGGTVKEVGFFDKEYRFSKGFGFYERHFVSGHPEACKFFEATPEYLYRAKVPGRIRAYAPDARLIVLLREPVARAFSAWNMYREWGESGVYPAILDRDPEGGAVNPLYETFIEPDSPPSFAEYVDMELAMIEAGDEREEPGLIRRGIYKPQIARYVELFGWDRLLILGAGELQRATRQTVQTAYRFVNESSAPIDDSALGIRYHVRDYSRGLDEATAGRLREFYRPHNQELFGYLGREVDW